MWEAPMFTHEARTRTHTVQVTGHYGIEWNEARYGEPGLNALGILNETWGSHI